MANTASLNASSRLTGSLEGTAPKRCERRPATRQSRQRGSSVAERCGRRRAAERCALAQMLVEPELLGLEFGLARDLAANPELVRILLSVRLERDPAGEDVGALLEAVHFDEVVRPERGRAPLVGAASAEEVGELEDERDQVDRDQEGQEELDVLLHRRACPLDAVERRLAGQEVAVGLDAGDTVRDLAAL